MPTAAAIPSKIQVTMRRRLLRIVPLVMLQNLSGMERPWNADRPTLEKRTLKAWDADIQHDIIEWIRSGLGENA